MTYRFCYRSYRLPLRVPLRTAHGLWGEREGLLVRLEDEAGRVGYGEIAPIPWFGSETLAEAEEICRALGDRVADQVLDAVAARFGCVRFAVAAARAREGAPVPTSARLPVAALLPAGRAGLAALPGKLEAGFLAFKWKVGVESPDEELGVFDDLLGLLPAYTRLRLDANGAWERRHAQRWLARCADRPVEFVEQPVAAGDDDTLLGLAREFPVTLALDESVVRLADAKRWQGLGWPGVFVIKPALCGPLAEIGQWIGETKADVVFSSAIETASARADILRFVLAADLTKRALGFGTGEMFGERLWDGPFVGALADAACTIDENREARWNALS